MPTTRKTGAKSRGGLAVKRRLRMLVGLVVIVLPLLTVGCGPTEAEIAADSGVRSYFRGDYDNSIRKLEDIADEPDKDYVLNNLRLGMAGLAAGDLDVAERGFYRAYEVMNAGRVNKGGREAAAVWLSEDLKVWKGEPYERAIANLHLGFVYYLHGDYNNARGAFENALFKLRDYEDADAASYDEVESAFGAALIMLGRTHQRLGRDDLAQQQFDRAADLVPYLRPLADAERHRRSNVLLIVGLANGPRKINVGGGALAFEPTVTTAGPLPPITVIVDGRRVSIDGADAPTYDAMTMAQQRRWQKIDTIRATKSLVGDGLLAGGVIVAGTADHEDQAFAGAGMALAGLLLKATSSADTRVWETAPRGVYLVPLDLPPGLHDITVRAGSLEATVLDVPAEPGGDTAVYLLPTRWGGLPPEANWDELP